MIWQIDATIFTYFTCFKTIIFLRLHIPHLSKLWSSNNPGAPLNNW